MEKLLEQAYNYQKKGQYEKSIRLFLKLRENKEYYEKSIMEIAKCYKMANEPIKAIDYFAELLKYNSENQEAIKELSQTACLSKNYVKAENVLKELFSKTKQNIFLIELIKIYFDKGDLNEIENIIDNNKSEHKILKDILDELKDINSDKDIDFYNKEIEQHKDDYLLYLERAKLKKEIGKYEQALEDFNIAISINNKDHYVFFERGRLKKEIKDYKGALEDFTKAINLNSNVYWFFLDLAMLQEEMGETDKYFLNLKKALDILNKDLSIGKDNIQLYIDKFCIQRYLGMNNDVSFILNKMKKFANDKLSESIKIIESVDLKRQKIAPYRCIFTWMMSPKCNYKCVYCPVCLFEKVKENIIEDKSVMDIIDSWKNIYDKYGSSRIRLTGGEPSIYPNFFEIIKKISTFHRLQLGTNLSFDVNKFCDVVEPNNVRVDASLHYEYVKLESFIKKIELLKKNKYKVTVSYVAYPDFIKNISLAKQAIETMQIPFFVHPFSGIYKGKVYPLSYTEEEKKQISRLDMKNNIEFESRKKNNNIEECFFDKNKTIKLESIKKITEIKKDSYLNNKKNNRYKKCKMGQMYAYIYPNGNVYRCCSSFNENYLGNLFDKTINLLEKAEKCYDIDYCKCWRCMVPGEEARWLHTWLDDWEMEIWEKK